MIRCLYRRTLAASVTVALLSLPSSAIFYSRLNQEKVAANKLTQVREEIEGIDELLTQLLNLETGVRGYVSTGDRRFLDPYWEGKRQVPVVLHRLEALHGKETTLRERVNQVLLLSDELIKNPRASSRLEKGKSVMDGIREILRETKSEDESVRDALLRQRQKRESSDLILAVLSLSIQVLLFWLVYQGVANMRLALNKAEESLELEEKLRITTQKLLEQEQELNRAKSTIIQTISHEYRTPLTTILTAAELLKNDLSVEKKTQYLEQIQEGVKRLTGLVNEVLEVFQLESGSVTLNPTPIHLRSWLQSLVEEFEDGDRVLVDVQVGEFQCDEALLHKVMNNLISNALKYSKKREAVFIWIKPVFEGIQIRIKDRGIGIPHSMRLYQPFERGSNVGTITGTGLGLSIVKKAVELLGGEISVSSTEGEGAEFVVTLPNS